MAEILVVDDELAVRRGIKALLQGEGYGVRTAKSGADALAIVAERRPDLVLLDVMMPGMNGFRVCEEIRRRDRLLPVVFLTALESEADQVRGMGLGGDDYIAKSAPSSVLLARVGRAVSRGAAVAAGLARSVPEVVRLGEVSVDMRSLAVSHGGAAEHLTRTEAGILAALLARRGEYVSLDELIEGVRGEGFACEDSMVYSHVSRLRRKLGPAGSLVVSVRGAGYMLADPRLGAR